MSIAHVNARQLRLVCDHSLRHSVRSGSGLVFLLLAVFLGLSVAYIFISPFESFVAESATFGAAPESVERNMVNFARPWIERLIAPRAVDDPQAQQRAEERTSRWVNYLLDDRPALLSAIFLVLLIGIPLLIPFGAFNQTAGDIGSRGLRYVLLRTERANIYYGRLLATMLLTIGAQALVVLTIALYLGLKVRVYGGWELTSWSLQGLLALSVLSLPYVAVCAWLSAAHDSPMGSLVTSNLIVGGVPLVAFLARFTWEPAYAVRYLLPWGVQDSLFAPDTFTVALAILACLGYTVAFTWLGARKFERRDL